jgi:ATP-binding cassette, subfamily B, multidrug efflux pump
MILVNLWPRNDRFSRGADRPSTGIGGDVCQRCVYWLEQAAVLAGAAGERPKQDSTFAILGSMAVRRLLPYLLRYRRRFALGFLCIVATTSIQLLSPWVLQHAVDDLTVGVTRAKLGTYAGLMLVIAAAGGVFRFLMRRIIIGVSRHLEYDLRNAFFEHLQRMPLEYFQRHRTGDLMSRATNDLGAVRMMIGPSIMYSASTGMVFMVAIVLMLSIDPWLTLVALVPLPFVYVSVRFFGTLIHRRFEKIQEQLSEISAVAQESLSGVRVIRAYGQETEEIERFRLANDEYVRRNRGLIRLQGAFYPSMTLFLGVGALLVLWLGSRAVIGGRITVGELVAFNAYLVMLAWPMIAFGWVTNMLQRGMASWKRMLEVMDEAPTIQGGDAVLPPSLPRPGRIEIRNLTFAYGDRPVLQDVSVTIEAGETVAIVGATGSGKSTLINLLPRLVDPPPQTVFIDGQDVRDLRLDVLRRAIGMVPQEPFLFSDTIAANVAFAPEAASLPDAERRSKIEWAATIARLDKDLPDFPNGYDTLVGERGLTLSGGQKQRTAIARAVIIEPTILVLDDALSAVDTYTEEEILSRLRLVMRQRTSLIVSHRISTVRDADLILVLDEGRVAERGRHDALVDMNGLYADLYRKQLLEEELATQ